jgi:hypothetical protein
LSQNKLEQKSGAPSSATTDCCGAALDEKYYNKLK